MNLDFLKQLTHRVTRSAQVALFSLSIIVIWVGTQLDMGEAIATSGETLKIEVSRMEILLILMLLFLNVMITYSLFKNYAKTNKIMKWSTSIIMITFLVVCIWIARVFHFQHIATDGSALVSGAINRIELILLMVMILGSILATLAQFKKFRNSEEILVMSSQSKKVKYRGEWVSIENFLEKELGVKISHGVTPEEKERAIAEFKQALNAQSESREASPS